MAKIYMQKNVPRNHREHFKSPKMKRLEARLINYMANCGVLMSGAYSVVLSRAMQAQYIDQFSEVF